MTHFNITIENCNSIDKAIVAITKNCLNIKYGPNGLGKSTIARALFAASKADDSLAALLPFKHRSNAAGNMPKVSGADDIKSVLVFDESYVSQFVFQRDEVVKNSFDIFINNDEFKTAMAEIETLFSGIKNAFATNEELEQAVADLKELRDAFSVTKTGAISKSSKGFKAFGSGNKIENIPASLAPYSDFLHSEQPSTWIAWQAKGNAYLDLSENCPYCSSSLKEEGKKETAKLVATEYDSKAVEHLSALQAVIERLGQYFEDGCRTSLEQITKSKIELKPEEITFLSNLRAEVETLLSRFESLRTISFFSLRDVDKIEDEIENLKINLGVLTKLSSDSTKAIVEPINKQLADLISKVGVLKGKIGAHKSQIQKTIAENQTHINGFLQSAGYKYTVEIKPEGDAYKMKLVHQDHSEHLETASEHLSYGERNAFALVLFMHQVLRGKPDLAVLDDPVSSFDKTKKFAILHELFRGKGSLRDSTVLMLTHDIEPAIDVTKSVRRLFQHSKPVAHFLSSKSGVVGEIKIEPTDIKTFAEICRENIQSADDVIIKCIYLRRHFEILGERGLEYNFLSSLLHGREKPTNQTNTGDVDMTAEQIAEATAAIVKEISDFDYMAARAILTNPEELKSRFEKATIGYDKIQLYRIFSELNKPANGSKPEDSIIRKFVNESFHIENEYVMQLNPHKFDNVPEYVIQECVNSINQN